MLPVLLRHSDYPFGIFKLFLTVFHSDIKVCVFCNWLGLFFKIAVSTLYVAMFK